MATPNSDNSGSGFVTGPDNTGSGFVTDNQSAGSGFVTESQSAGSGFVTESQSAGSGFAAESQSAGSGFVTESQSAGSGFVTDNQKPQKPASGLSSTFSDIQVLSSQGAMSTVYKGKKYGKWHIIKRIKPEFKDNPQYRELFLKEFDNGIQLDHPNIVRLEDKGEDADGLWYTMEYVDGRSLGQMISKNELKSDSLKKSLLMQLCDALSYVHKKQIVHRDLKPENILVTYRGDNAKVLDFGLAYADSYDDHMKQVGTPRYAAPEQMTKGNMVDQRADIYALGLILLEMCTGDITDREAKTVENPNFWTIIRKATKENPADRYYNCQEIIDDLGRNIVKLQEPEPPAPPKPQAPKPEPPKPAPAMKPATEVKPAQAGQPKSSKGLIIGIAAAVAVAGIAAFILLGSGKPGDSGVADATEQNSGNNHSGAGASEGKSENSEKTDSHETNKIANEEKEDENSETAKLMSQANKLFDDEKNIARARGIYEKVLQIDPAHEKAKDRLNSCQKIMDASKIGDLSPVMGDGGKYGFADNSGYILIDFEYDKDKPYMPGQPKSLYAIKKNGKYGIFNDKTKKPETDFKYNKIIAVGQMKWRLHKNPTGQPQDYISEDAQGNINLEENKM